MTTSQKATIQVARNLPISNTGSVVLHVRAILKGGAGQAIDIVLGVNQTVLIFPGEYEVYSAIDIPKPPNVVTGPGPVVLPLAHISYDQALQHFNVQVNPKANFSNGQFSVLVNLSDLASN